MGSGAPPTGDGNSCVEPELILKMGATIGDRETGLQLNGRGKGYHEQTH